MNLLSTLYNKEQYHTYVKHEPVSDQSLLVYSSTKRCGDWLGRDMSDRIEFDLTKPQFRLSS